MKTLVSKPGVSPGILVDSLQVAENIGAVDQD